MHLNTHRLASVLTVALAILFSTAIPLSAASAPAVEGRGAMVDVGGFKLSTYCQGTGSPAVILDSGYGEELATWYLVQPMIAGFTRVCAFDRAGIFPSNPRPGHSWNTAQNTVHDLHEVLSKLHVAPPYVMVGHGIGGIDLRLYARRYPRDLAGMVLVNADNEEQCKWALCATARGERYDIRTSVAQLHAALSGKIHDSLGATPLVVISRGLYPPGDTLIGTWKMLQTQLADASSNSVHAVAKMSGDDVLQNQPDLVIRAIELVLQSIRERSSRLVPCALSFGPELYASCAAT